MRILSIVILSLIIAHTDRVLGQKRGKAKQNNEGPCGKRYLRKLQNKCYYFAMKKMNWFGAQNNCLRKGLNLADLSTSEDYNAVLHYLKAQGNMEDFWFGGNDLQTEGQYTYISNGQLVRYLGTNVGGMEPTHRSNLDDCLEVRLRENNTMIIDDNCQEKQYFICEKNGLECATPTSTATAETKHSHEHLHHFHHNAGKGEEAGTDNEGVESDSRPADNTNSTEVGTSQEDQNETTTDDFEPQTQMESDENEKETEKETKDKPEDETTTETVTTTNTAEGTQKPDETTIEGSTAGEGITTLPSESPGTNAKSKEEELTSPGPEESTTAETSPGPEESTTAETSPGPEESTTAETSPGPEKSTTAEPDVTDTSPTSNPTE